MVVNSKSLALLLLLLGALAYSLANASTLQLVYPALSIVNSDQGIVLIYISGSTYGAICDANWTLANAQVVCRQLGYNVTVATTYTPQYNSAYGTPQGVTGVISGVNCVGNEVDLTDCQYYAVSTNPSTACANTEFAGVTCLGGLINSVSTAAVVTCAATSTAQLVNGNSSTNGRLQVAQNGTWGSVCSAGFTQADAQVACNSMCSNASYYQGTAYPGSVYGVGTSPIVLANVSCVGTESNILNCPSNGFNASTNCTDAVGINCASNIPSYIPTGSLICSASQMQLVYSQSTSVVISNITVTNTSACQNASSQVFSNAALTYSLTLLYTDCGTTSTVTYNAAGLPAYYVYGNTVLVTVTTSSGVITRVNQFSMNLQCSIQRSATASSGFSTTTVSVPLSNGTSSAIQATISFYSDAGFTNVLSSPAFVQLNSPIYAQVVVSQVALTAGYRALVPTCLASPFANMSAPQYYLIQNNCVNDSTYVSFTTNSQLTLAFVFYSFQFVGSYTGVYLECTVLLCANSDTSGLCSGTCDSGSSRKKRAAESVSKGQLYSGQMLLYGDGAGPSHPASSTDVITRSSTVVEVVAGGSSTSSNALGTGTSTVPNLITASANQLGNQLVTIGLAATAALLLHQL